MCKELNNEDEFFDKNLSTTFLNLCYFEDNLKKSKSKERTCKNANTGKEQNKRSQSAKNPKKDFIRRNIEVSKPTEIID